MPCTKKYTHGSERANITLLYIHLRHSEIYDTGNCDDGWFGKINILTFGDLLQLPPVNELSPFLPMQAKKCDKYINALGTINLWEKLFTYDELTENTRQKNDSIYANILERIRINNISQSDITTINERKIKFNSNDKSDIIKQLYHLIIQLPESTFVLLPTRNYCSILNNGILSLLPSKNVCLVAVDSVDCKETTKSKVVKKLSKLDDDNSRTAGLEKYINVKLNCKIMLQRNIDETNGLVNGAMGTIVNVINGMDGEPEKIQVVFNNKCYYLERITGKFEVFHGAYVYRKQFPITVAYGITIHKSRGMSLDNPKNIKAQVVAIKEYNRLREKYRPDLGKIPLLSTKNRHIKDLIWTDSSNIRANNAQIPSTSYQDIPHHTIPGFSNSNNISCYANSSLTTVPIY